MTAGLPAISITAPGLPALVQRMARVPVATQNVATRNLSRLGQQGGTILRGFLSGGVVKDPFWGVTGTRNPIGLAPRTGNTRRHVVATGQVYRSGLDIWTFIAHPDVHMRALEAGGVVQGKPWLKIPTAAVQTPSGAIKQEFSARGKQPGTFIWPNKRTPNLQARIKTLWIARAKPGKRGGLQLLWMLKRSVTLKPHRSFATLSTALAPKLLTMGRETLAVVVQEV